MSVSAISAASLSYDLLLLTSGTSTPTTDTVSGAILGPNPIFSFKIC